jgi:hypothetical protein
VVYAVQAVSRQIQSHDAIAVGAEYLRRLSMRGSECRLTPKDHAAIERAGSYNKEHKP